MMKAYPVHEVLPELKSTLSQNNIVILQAPPGAGKSTVLPLEIMEQPWLQGKKIIMLEPRRLAAKSVAERMADTVGEPVGKRIGYRVRFDTKVSADTKIEVVTDGILARMIQSDNSLEEAGLIIFDEFHERSLQADLGLALSLQIQQVLRDDLRLLIMSATLDGEHLSSLLSGAPIITSRGRQFPIEYRYVSQESDAPVSIRAALTIRKALKEESGDILVFLPGAGEIKRTQEILEAESVSASIHPLYGDLSFKKQQDAIFSSKDGRRKIVLATSIAETSLTIEGIRVVIDAGLSRVPRFDPRSGLTKLETVRVTKDAADQRAGRAGRLGPGICFRLWTEGVQLNLIPQRKPEILDADLATLMLELAQWGIKDIKQLTWITPPPAGAVNQAINLLTVLDALNAQGITSRGKEMLKLPTHPRIAHLLLEAKAAATNNAQSAKYISLATDIAALLEERDPLQKESGVDLTLRVEVLRRWRDGEKVYADQTVLDRIEKLAMHWRKIMKISEDNKMPSEGDVGLLLMAAYPERIAQQQGKYSDRYKLANGRIVKLPQHDPMLRETWLSVSHLDAGGNEGKIFMAASVHVNCLEARAQEVEVVRWDEERRMVVGLVERRVGALLLDSKPVSKIDEALRSQVLCAQVKQKGLEILGWSESEEAFQARVLSLQQWRPDDGWPLLTDEQLIDTIDEWLPPYLINVYKQSELERLDIHAILKAMLPWHLQNTIDALAPTKIEVPSGSMIKVNYFSDGRSPVIEVRLQEMFGLSETPTINEGRTKILLHLLSPGYKPVQVTQDLKSFWHSAYHEVRKELRQRYPRHHWPEDPWTAEAVRGARRRNS